MIVLRTFSKAYGLAGARVGYAVGDPDVITALGKVYVPFTATSVCAGRRDRLGGRRRRTDGPHRRRRRRTRPGQRRTARRRLHAAAVAGQLRLAAAGPERTADFVEQAANARILVRPYGTDGVRVTIGAPHENDAFLAFARTYPRRTT